MQAAAPQGFGAHWMARQRLGEPGEVFTFYSYKGGTGRTMGLVNCAGLITQQLPSGAKPLLLIDFDLEAPGLHRYLVPGLAGYVSDKQPGVLELFEALAQQVDALLGQRKLTALDDESVMALVAAVDLSPYKMPVRLPVDGKPAPTSGTAALQLIVAGRFSKDYDERLQRFNWPQLFTRAPALFRALSARLAAEHSFVFVDSRTGLSDTSGISTMLLPDVLVVVFTPNSQSLTGIDHLVRKAVDYRAKAPDLRPLRVYPLVSRVDNQVEYFRQVWRMGDAQHPLFGAVAGYQPLFADLFGSLFPDAQAKQLAELTPRLGEYFDQVQVPHASDYAFGERLCFTQQASGDSLSIRGAYELFLPWLVTGAQPWERPSDKLVDLRAALWLREAGVAEGLASEDGWPAWFDRVARLAVATDEADAPLPLAALSADRRFDVALARSLALAHVGDFGQARSALEMAAAAYGEESAPSLSGKAPAALLKLLHGDPPPAEAKADAAAWLEGLDKLMARWQPLRLERQAWLEALMPLAVQWLLPELCWRAAVALGGEGSVQAQEAQLAAAQARLASGDVTGALTLLEALAGTQESTSPHTMAVARKLLPRVRVQAGSGQFRLLPSINECDSTAWVSFVRADNEVAFSWIKQLQVELTVGLTARLRGTRLPPLSAASGAEGEETAVTEALSRQLTRCFSFILVVGDEGWRSKRCQSEVAHFIDLYGPAAQQRVYVLALTERAMRGVAMWRVWQKLGAPGQMIMTPFFTRSDPERPMPIFLNAGAINPEFRVAFERLRDDLAMKIRATAEAAPPTPHSPAAILSQMQAPATAAAQAQATLYVESNRFERSLWQPIGRLLRERWDHLQPVGAAALALRVRGLPLDTDQGLALLDDADGVLLLWGKQTPRDLLDQVNKVEGAFAHGRDPCPGAVAHLSPPRLPADEPIPAWGWRVLRFLRHEPDAPAVHADDADELGRFLSEVMRHAAARGQGAAA
jgi:cellulose biosynthesis protein BcsQ